MPDGDGLWATERIVAARTCRHPHRHRHHLRTRRVRRASHQGGRKRLPGEGHRAGRADPRRAGGRRRGRAAVAERHPAPARAGRRHASQPRMPARSTCSPSGSARCSGWSAAASPTRRSPRRSFLSPLTAKTHVSRIMSKLAARDRVHLVVVAYETGLVRAGVAGSSTAASGCSARSTQKHPPGRFAQARPQREWCQRFHRNPLREGKHSC